jgi:hypothetical protein
MSIPERKIIAVAMLLSLLWGAGLFAVYMLRDSTEASHPGQLAAPEIVRGDEPVAPAPAPMIVRGALTFPASGAVVPITLDVDARRKQLTEVRSHIAGENRQQYGWQSRYQDRTGQVLVSAIAPTTVPSTSPSTSPNTSPSIAATLVTVHLTKASLRQALVAVANAAKVKISVAPSGWIDSSADLPPISLNADSQPLMEVMNEILCKSASQLSAPGMSMWGGEVSATDPATPVLHLEHQQADASLGPWEISGPFSFEVQRMFHAAPLFDRADAGSDSATAQVTLKMTQEPSVVVLGASQQPTVTEAADDKGHSLISDVAPETPVQREGFSWGGLLAAAVGLSTPPPADASTSENWTSDGQGITLQLRCPPDVGHTLAKLTGTERLLIQQKSARLELPIASPPVDQDKVIGGVSLTVSGWQVFSAQQCSFRLTFHRTSQDATQWGRLQAAIRKLNPVLFDASGAPFPAARTWNSGANGMNDCFCEYMFQDNGNGRDESQTRKPARLLVDLPTAFITLEVPFHFENLPLP